MALNLQNALGVHADALRLRAQRTQVLASNLANVSTPGYQARDIDFGAELQRLRAGGETSTAPGRLSAAALDTTEALYRVPNHPTQDGNTVELGVEQALFSQNASDFQTSLTFLNMQLRGLQQAIRGE